MRYYLLRNLKLYFQDKVTIFFSFLSPVIFIGLYFGFFRQMNDGQQGLISDYMMLSALTVLTIFNTVLGGLSRVVDDELSGARKDFLVTPLSNRSLALGIVGSAALIGMSFGFIFIAAMQAVLALLGHELLSLGAILKLLPLTLFIALFFAVLIYVPLSYIKSRGGYAAFSSLTGSGIGFLSGMFLPIGMLSGGFLLFAKLFPVTHATRLFKQVVALDKEELFFGGMPELALTKLKEFLGLSMSLGETKISWQLSLVYLLPLGALFSLWAIRRARRGS